MFANFSLNQTTDVLDSYGLMGEMPDYRKHEGNVRATLPPWPETKFNCTIGKEENRRVKLD